MMGRVGVVLAVLSCACGRLGFDAPNRAVDGGIADGSGGDGASAVDAGFSAELWVSPTGSDSGVGSENDPLLTLAEAASRVEPGTRVWIEPGTYTGFTLNTSGEDGALIHFEGTATGVAIEPASAADPTITFAASFAQLHNVELECATTCFLADPGAGATALEQVKTGNVTFVGGTRQLIARNTAGLFVHASTFTGGEEAIRLDAGAHFASIHDCRIDATSASISLDGAAADPIQSPWIARNELTARVILDTVRTPRIESNLSLSDVGLFIETVDGGRVINNTIVADTAAIRIEGGVQGSIVTFNNVLFATEGASALEVIASTDVTSDRNVLAGAIIVGGIGASLQIWQATGNGATSFAADAADLFENLGTGDLTPPPGGGLVREAGLDSFAGLPAPTLDLVAVDRPVGAYDIGAWED